MRNWPSRREDEETEAVLGYAKRYPHADDADEEVPQDLPSVRAGMCLEKCLRLIPTQGSKKNHGFCERTVGRRAQSAKQASTPNWPWK